MKLSVEAANKYLKELGVNAEVVADDKADKDIKIEDLVTETNDAIKESLKGELETEANEEAVKAAVAKETGKLLGTMRSGLAKIFGGTNSLYTKGQGDKELTIQEAIALSKSTYDTRKGNEATDWEKQREELIKDYEDQLEEKDKAVEAKDGEITKINTDWQGKFDDRDISAHLSEVMGKVPRKGGNVAKQANMFKQELSSDYVLKFNPATKKLELFDKEGKPAKENGKVIDLEQKAKKWAEEAGVLATDTRGIRASDVKKGEESGAASGVVKTGQEEQPDDKMSAIAAWAEGE